MTGKQKTNLNEGDQIILKFSKGHWSAHVKFASGGIAGRAVPFKSFDEAVAALKEDHAL